MSVSAQQLSLIVQIDQLLPQTQCGLCGHRDGCLPYAKSIAEGEDANKCVPGGQPVADALAILLKRPTLLAEPSVWDIQADGRPQQMKAVIREDEGIGCIPFSPLAQGLLTNKYLKGVPEDSRAAKPHGFLKTAMITPEKLEQIQQLNTLAQERGQSLAQMALSWILKDRRVTSVLVGASRPAQLLDSLECLKNTNFSAEELAKIETILK